MKRAFITGITGQDGSHLADILLEKGYEVHGLVRPTSASKHSNISHLLDRIRTYSGDITDAVSLTRIIDQVEPDELYHEADQDNVGISFNNPSLSMEVTVKAVANLLEIITLLPSPSRPKIFLPSSATIFGDCPAPQTERSPLNPQSPYAIGKVAVLHLGNYYRDIHGLKITTGILYNHDSNRRNGSYLLHDICRMAVLCSQGKLKDTGDRFSNIDETVNLGSARHYMKIVHKLLSENHFDNFLIGSMYNISIRDLMGIAFSACALNYRDYMKTVQPLKANPRNRPGKIEKFEPNLTKLGGVINLKQVKTDYTDLVIEIVAKYQKELQ